MTEMIRCRCVFGTEAITVEPHHAGHIEICFWRNDIDGGVPWRDRFHNMWDAFRGRGLLGAGVVLDGDGQRELADAVAVAVDQSGTAT